MDLFSTAPRPHPARLRVDSYPLTEVMHARYADMDVNGHLNNLALEALHENIRATMNSRVVPEIYQASKTSLRCVTAQNVVHFLAESHWPAEILGAIGIPEIGRSSYVASSALFLAGTCISLCDTLIVAVDDDGPFELPAAARQILRQLELAPG